MGSESIMLFEGNPSEWLKVRLRSLKLQISLNAASPLFWINACCCTNRDVVYLWGPVLENNKALRIMKKQRESIIYKKKKLHTPSNIAHLIAESDDSWFAAISHHNTMFIFQIRINLPVKWGMCSQLNSHFIATAFQLH